MRARWLIVVSLAALAATIVLAWAAYSALLGPYL